MAKRGKRKSKSRAGARKVGFISLAILAIWGVTAEWFVHHPRNWVRERSNPLTAPLLWFGNPLADLTDGLGWTGHDTVYEYDTEAPSGEIMFAGAPKRIGAPSPADIVPVNRGEFIIGWSPSLRHPVWCAYHVTQDALHEAGKRPGFSTDKSVARCPRPDDYDHSGYDRGHMAPNYAIATRYGEDAQRKTFLISNIAPQAPSLNRGVWRDLEHRIADLWTARYGEIWVVVGCIPSSCGETLSGTDIDVPERFYQVVTAQEGLDIRAFAVVFDQFPSWNEWTARNLVSIDELERLTGLDFLPELPDFIQAPLEADLPTRLWPVRTLDVVRQILLRFTK